MCGGRSVTVRAENAHICSVDKIIAIIVGERSDACSCRSGIVRDGLSCEPINVTKLADYYSAASHWCVDNSRVDRINITTSTSGAATCCSNSVESRIIGASVLRHLSYD